MTIGKEIYYVGFYNDDIGKLEKRYSVPSAVNKMDYIANSLKSIGHKVKILSPSWSKKKKYAYFKGRSVLNKNMIPVEFTPTFSSPIRIMVWFSSVFSLFWLFFKLVKATSKNSYVLLYHSTFYYLPIYLAKKICKFKLILEVEEIYHLFTRSLESRENKIFSLSDSYLFSNINIHNYLNKKDKNKLFVVVNGEYYFGSMNNVKKRNSDLINVVFAGNVETVRRGAFNAVACSKYLDQRYVVKIIGFGNENEISRLNKEINKVNRGFDNKKCKYFGVKYESDYDDFLFNCDIAINPQELKEDYMQFAFPSKILSYLGHNLRVVTTQLSAIEDSEFRDLVKMVPNYSPRKFAEAIMSLDLQEPFTPLDRIKEADVNFRFNLKKIFN